MGYWTGYPYHVFLVLANEFCERFSYYGMRAVLVFFLWKGLGYSESVSTSIYHAFVVLCYLSPLFGAMIADGWLGKYKTILYISIIYAVGNILMTVSALDINGYTGWLAFIGLAVIGFGTGGIKPCVSSFGGDQFTDDQKKQKESFFSLFYLTINIGSTISTIIVPFLRGNVYCFGDNCYALCFGIPAILMVLSIVLFLVGTKWYVINPPGDSILRKFFGCIWTALARKCSCKSGGKQADHWLEGASPDYDDDFIEDVKDVLRVAWLFIPLPVFWALFDMQGSKWILQAQQMDGDFKNVTIYPDMIHFLNPLLVVILVPLLEYAVYPCLDKLRIPNRPLQRMTLGMILATVSFLITGFLQLAINAQQPMYIAEGQTKFQIINTSPNELFVSYKGPDDAEYIKLKIGAFESSGDYIYKAKGVYDFDMKYVNEQTWSFEFQNQKAYQVFVKEDANNLPLNFTVEQGTTDKTSKGESRARVFNGLAFETNVYLESPQTEDIIFDNITSNGVSNEKILVAGSFPVKYKDNTGQLKDVEGEITSKNGAVYTLFLTQDSSSDVVMKQLVEIDPWSINIFMQTPQYVVMALAETLFSVTGLAFAYTQAPVSMKSILTAIWLLTVCVGNIIIIIVQGASTSMDMAVEFFLYTGLMALTTIAFFIMSLFYTYVTPRVSLEDKEKIDVMDAKVEIPCPPYIQPDEDTTQF